MDRAEGLVRRNKSRVDNASSEGNSSTAHSVDENDVILNDGDNYNNDNDSKETRLTLMEEVLLLGLKDKEVNMCPKCEQVDDVRNVKILHIRSKRKFLSFEIQFGILFLSSLLLHSPRVMNSVWICRRPIDSSIFHSLEFLCLSSFFSLSSWQKCQNLFLFISLNGNRPRNQIHDKCVFNVCTCV